MIEYDAQYKALLKRIIASGVDIPDRTGVGVRKVFDANFNVDLSSDSKARLKLPALTLRKAFPRTAFYELMWMLSGSTDATILQRRNISIWEGNTSREFLDAQGLTHIREGHGGKIYGHQFRNFNGYDQLAAVVDSLKTSPNSRRHFISLWNPTDLDEMALPPCHVSYQFCVIGDKLHLKFYQRSADVILGVPMNILFASLFLHWMAIVTGYEAGSVAHSICDAHIYSNHLEVACDLIEREPIDHTATIRPILLKSCAQIDKTHLLSVFEEDEFGPYDRFASLADLVYESNPAIPKEKLVMAV